MTNWKADPKVIARRDAVCAAAEEFHCVSFFDLELLCEAVAASGSPPSPHEQKCVICEGTGRLDYPKGVTAGSSFVTATTENYACHRCGGSGVVRVGFPDESYAYPLERRLDLIDFSHPRLGLKSTGHHSVPLTTEEGQRLLALLRASSGSTGAPDALREAFLAKPCNLCGKARDWALDGQLQAVCYSCGSTGGAPTRKQIEALRKEHKNGCGVYRQTAGDPDIRCNCGAQPYNLLLNDVLALFDGAASRVPSESPAPKRPVKGIAVAGRDRAPMALPKYEGASEVRAAVREALTKLAEHADCVPTDGVLDAQDIQVFRDREYPALSSESPARPASASSEEPPLDHAAGRSPAEVPPNWKASEEVQTKREAFNRARREWHEKYPDGSQPPQALMTPLLDELLDAVWRSAQPHD